ncbi:unnamed protein product [Agarophyton chilense]
MLKERANEKDDHVRCIALQSIGKFIHRASESLLQVMALRLCDRKQQVRKAALLQVYELFMNATPSYSRPSPSSEPHEERNFLMDCRENKESIGEALGRRRPRSSIETVTMNDVLETRMLKHSWLPDAILRSYMALNDAGDQKRAREIERLILKRIIATWEHDGVSIRAGLCRVAIFISQLSEPSYEHLMAIVRSWWNTRAALISIAQFRLNSRKACVPLSHVKRQTTPFYLTFSRKSHSEGRDKNISTAIPSIGLRNHAFALASLLSARIAAPILLSTARSIACLSLPPFATAADLKVFEKILKAVHPLSTCVEVADARQDVVSRLGSYLAAACDIAKRESFIPSIDCAEDGPMTQMVSESGKRILPGILRFLEIVATDCSEVLGFKVDESRSLFDVKLGASDSSADVILCGMRQVCRLPAQSSHEAGNDKLLLKLKTHLAQRTSSNSRLNSSFSKTRVTKQFPGPLAGVMLHSKKSHTSLSLELWHRPMTCAYQYT